MFNTVGLTWKRNAYFRLFIFAWRLTAKSIVHELIYECCSQSRFFHFVAKSWKWFLANVATKIYNSWCFKRCPTRLNHQIMHSVQIRITYGYPFQNVEITKVYQPSSLEFLVRTQLLKQRSLGRGSAVSQIYRYGCPIGAVDSSIAYSSELTNSNTMPEILAWHALLQFRQSRLHLRNSSRRFPIHLYICVRWSVCMVPSTRKPPKQELGVLEIIMCTVWSLLVSIFKLLHQAKKTLHSFIIGRLNESEDSHSLHNRSALILLLSFCKSELHTVGLAEIWRPYKHLMSTATSQIWLVRWRKHKSAYYAASLLRFFTAFWMFLT